MNWKIPAAFTAGALIASGIVYVAVKDTPVSAAPPVSTEPPRPVVASVPAPPPPVAAVPVAPPVRVKPSPMPPPVHREKPATVARAQTPQVPEAKPPIEAQIPKEPEPAPVVQEQAPPPQPAQASPPQPEEAPPPQPQPQPEARVPNTVTIRPGTLLQVRIGETISAARHQSGDVFLATLDRPLVIDGFIIAEKGSRLEGRVSEAQNAGRGSTASFVSIELVKLYTSDGQRVQIRTQHYRKDAASSAGGDAAKVGAGAALGAVIGAAAGGGRGAAIGAGAGAAAGGIGAAATRGKTAEIPVETRVSFRIENPVTLTERLN
ncbi:MAG TPA: hypothetical protein VKT81_05110 [Bryobacteraceae bacterium]|nr:hypothetical protein [Bryobacteraceae bacterium]